MRKLITICILVVTLLADGMTMEAKTTKKKGKTKNNSSVICKLKYNDTNPNSDSHNLTVSLLNNGKIKTSSKCLRGNYEKLSGAYKINIYSAPYSYCGDTMWQDLIVGDEVYSIGGGTDGDCIHEFTFDPSNNSVTIINSSYDLTDKEFMEFNDLPSLTVPLSHFEKVGKVTWMK